MKDTKGKFKGKKGKDKYIFMNILPEVLIVIVGLIWIIYSIFN